MKKGSDYGRYVIGTIAYGVVALLGLLLLVIGIIIRNYILSFVCALIIWVAVDNFFCGSRCDIDRHYIIPPFLKRK